MMTRQLATLINAGFTLVSAIDTLIPQTRTSAMKKTLARIKDSVIEGNNFADALSLYPHIFSPLYINMVRAGEASGTLEIILEQIAEINEKQTNLNSQIKTAVAYPVFMSFVGAMVLFFLLAFVVPNITSMFEDMNQALPGPTRFLINVSDLFKAYWWIILIIIPGTIYGFQAVKKTEKGTWWLHRIFLSFPGVGSLVKKLAAVRFTRTLGSLLQNGVTMLKALEIAKNVTGNVLISDAIDTAGKEVEEGKGLGKSLSASDRFPYLVIQMIQVGEQSGSLESMLKKVSDVFESEVESTIMRLTSLLEPFMILVMAVIVGFIVLSICLPIFEMNQLVK
jgi:general secretion pathway protein F